MIFLGETYEGCLCGPYISNFKIVGEYVEKNRKFFFLKTDWIGNCCNYGNVYEKSSMTGTDKSKRFLSLSFDSLFIILRFNLYSVFSFSSLIYFLLFWKFFSYVLTLVIRNPVSNLVSLIAYFKTRRIFDLSFVCPV